MESLSNDVLRATADKLIAAHAEASRTTDWTFFVDELYAGDCVYTCQYAGVMEVTANGIDEIKATHTFPYMGVYTGTDNRLVTHWMNRGPGKREDGSYFETPGISFLTLDDEAKICRQFDMFDLAHQMRLCDDLEEAGLLSPQLKDEWVLPMKGRLIEQLNRNR
jgi:hypothetical protein